MLFEYFEDQGDHTGSVTADLSLRATQLDRRQGLGARRPAVWLYRQRAGRRVHPPRACPMDVSATSLGQNT